MSRSAHAKPTDEQDKILLRLFFLLTAGKKPRWKQVACQQLPFNLIYLKQIRFLQTGGDGLSTASCRATLCASQSRYTAKLPSDASPWQQDTPSQRRMSSGLVDTSNEVSKFELHCSSLLCDPDRAASCQWINHFDNEDILETEGWTS